MNNTEESIIMAFIKKNIIFGIIGILSLVIIAFIIFWFSIFFVDEYNYVYLDYSNDDLSVVTDPSNLFNKKISKLTDVVATFKNSSQTECEVSVQSEALDITFTLKPELEYGILFPKKEDISVSFCGVKKTIYLNK